MEDSFRKVYLFKLGFYNLENALIKMEVKQKILQYMKHCLDFFDRFPSKNNDNELHATFLEDFVPEFDKQNDSFRYKYINALSKNKYLFESKPKVYQSIVIFDWDDTLFPTSSFSKNMQNSDFGENVPLDEELGENLKQIENLICILFDKLIKQSEIWIVTNALDGWVEFCANKYFPKVKERIEKYKINVVSARSKFEALYPDNVNKWKAMVFFEIGEKMNKEMITNIIVIGDSSIEIEATRSLTRHFNQASSQFLQSLKLLN